MSHHRMKLPDVGEGVAEAELVEWLVAVGDEVTPDTPVAELLTDKTNVEISAPVTGRVVELHGEPGDVLAVGSDLITIDTGGAAEPIEPGGDAVEPAEEPAPPAGEPDAPRAAPEDVTHDHGATDGPDTDEAGAERPSTERSPTARRALASPAVRARASSLGIDLATVSGTGPEGRVVHGDLDRLLTASRGRPSAASVTASPEGRVEAVRGVRRRIADRLSAAWADIPHITYVEAIDATELERLRGELNDRSIEGASRLTLLPFLARAIVLALADQPRLNAHYDGASEELTVFDAVHVGIATQTDEGLRVPVVRHAEARGLRDLGDLITRGAEAARDGRAARDDLTGSTITITSLGALGGLATTPIINPPEVAIVGVNKLETRPVWRDGRFEPREVFNLSSSFDHRIVDGWDAAVFVQRIKALLETPALLFVDH